MTTQLQHNLFGDVTSPSTDNAPAEGDNKTKLHKSVPMSSIEAFGFDDESQLRPTLKSGVQLSQPIFEKDESLIVAAAHYAIRIHHPGARAIIAKLDGTNCAKDISAEILAPLEVVEKVIEQLLSAQLVDTKKSKMRLHNRFHSPIQQRAVNTEDQSNDAFFKQLQQRMAPELTSTTWIEGVTDGGVEILSARQSFGVEIHGNNRLATLIYSGLLASGVTNTKFSLGSRRELRSIGDKDLGTGVLRINDYGLNYMARIEELSREWSLFPTPIKKTSHPGGAPILENNLRVVVGNYPTELVNQLMRDGLNHLFVGQIMGSSTQCGPLVLPSKSPCRGCAELSRSELLGVGQLVAISPANDELPVAVGYHVAGAALLAILQFIDTGVSELVGAQLNFDYLSAAGSETIRIARHPKCICNWE